MPRKVKKINLCRICGNNEFSNLINFNKIPLGNDLEVTKYKANKADTFKLAVIKCNNCNHFQLTHHVHPEKLYANNYTYLSGVGKTFLDHLNQYAKDVSNFCNLKNNSFIVDIGSNDGSCLLEFKKIGFRVCGVDPAKIPVSIALNRGIYSIQDFFDANVVKTIINKYDQADLVTSQNVLAHVANLRIVFEDIHKLLKDNRYLSFEVGYFRDVLENYYFDTIYHEHHDYHHANPLVQLLNSIGFSIIDISTNPIQGGSLRIIAQKSKKKIISQKAKAFLKNEKQSILFNKKFLFSWSKNINMMTKKINNYINAQLHANKNIIGYGSPTKAVLLLDQCSLNNKHIKYIIEDNKHKVGRYLPKLNIPIRENIEENYKDVDIIIVLAWNFADDIIKKIKMKVNKETQVIIPLPKFKIVNL